MQNPQEQVIPLGQQRLRLIRDWLGPDQADGLLELLPRQLPWRQERIRLYGREVAVPRLQCWVGDPGTRYAYSGLVLEPEPWPDLLQPIRRRLSDETGHAFNSVLCNWYRNGSDSMGWHSDNEPELGPAPVIASLTLGQTRRFQFRPRGGSRVGTSIDLPHNSLMLMESGVQEHWQHQLPKSRRALGDRINLTFRQVRGSRSADTAGP